LAGIGALCLNPIPVRRPLARRAFKALPKAHVEQVIEASFVVRKLAEKLGGGEGLRAHAPLYAAFVLRMQVG